MVNIASPVHKSHQRLNMRLHSVDIIVYREINSIDVHNIPQHDPGTFLSGHNLLIDFNICKCVINNNNNGYFLVLFLQRAHSPFIQKMQCT